MAYLLASLACFVSSITVSLFKPLEDLMLYLIDPNVEP
jgi:hypothetical protein